MELRADNQLYCFNFKKVLLLQIWIFLEHLPKCVTKRRKAWYDSFSLLELYIERDYMGLKS